MSTQNDIAEIIRENCYSESADSPVFGADIAAEEIVALFPGEADLRNALKETIMNLESVVETAQRVLDRARRRLEGG